MSFRHLLSVLALLTSATLVACAPVGSGDDDDSTEEEVKPPGPVYSGGACPVLEEGVNTGFDSAGLDREFQLLLPDEPRNAPVVFVWHWLGGSASEILSAMEFEDLPGDEGAIVIAPESRDNEQFEWSFLSESTDNPDLQFFEDMLSCVHEQYWVDMDRVFATGMSAGGLWSSYLTIHEARWLAATAPFSGGALADLYVTPVRPLPVLLTWGGPTDFAVGFNFHTANETLRDELVSDGSFVIECEHASGHIPPDGGKDYAWRFFEDHPMGVDPLPYEEDLPDSFPVFCGLAE